MRKSFFPPLLAVALLMTLPMSTAELVADEPAELEEALESRVEELRRQIEELLAEVPEELRDEVRRRLLNSEDPVEDANLEGSKPSAPGAPTTAEEAMANAPAVVESTTTDAVAPEPTAASSSTTAPSAAELASGEPVAPPSPPRLRRRRCNTLDLLDENADLRITALDRDWRYLYLWVDKNQDSRMAEDEIESAYALGVREIALHLETFVRKKKGGIGEIRRGDNILFDLRGNGFGTTSRPDDGALAVDATALARGGGPQLFSADGQKIEGIQLFQQGWQIHIEGTVVELSCP